MSGILAGSLVVATLSLMFLGWISSEVLEGDTLAIDNAFRAWLHSFASPTLTEIMRAVTQAGSVTAQVIGTLLVLISFWRIGWHRRAVLFLVMMTGASLLLMILKASFHRTRPEPYFDYPLPSSYSFPSGHALLSFCFYLGLAALITQHHRYAGRAALIWMSAILLTLAIGLSRIYLSVHYLTDVIAGFTAATVWTSGVAWTYRRISRRNPRGGMNPDVTTVGGTTI